MATLRDFRGCVGLIHSHHEDRQIAPVASDLLLPVHGRWQCGCGVHWLWKRGVRFLRQGMDYDADRVGQPWLCRLSPTEAERWPHDRLNVSNTVQTTTPRVMSRGLLVHGSIVCCEDHSRDHRNQASARRLPPLHPPSTSAQWSTASLA